MSETSTVFAGSESIPQFIELGIIVPVWIVPEHGRRRAVRVLAQLDTGSTQSSIDVGLAHLLRLRPQGRVPVAGFGGTVKSPLYAASIWTDGGINLSPGPVLGAVLASPPIRTWADLDAAQIQQEPLALLGREVLVHLRLSVADGTWQATLA